MPPCTEASELEEIHVDDVLKSLKQRAPNDYTIPSSVSSVPNDHHIIFFVAYHAYLVLEYMIPYRKIREIVTNI